MDKEMNNNFELNVSNTGEKITLSKDNYLKYLKQILERQINDEEYDECLKTQHLINKINYE